MPGIFFLNNSGLDLTANAGHTGNWWGVLTDKNGEPMVQSWEDEFPGMYISITKLEDRNKVRTDPARYVDSRNVPYIVYYNSDRDKGARAGDLAIVLNKTTTEAHAAILADYRGKGNGEGSIFLAQLHHLNTNPRNGGTNDKRYCFIIFPGSSLGWPISNTAIRSSAMRLYREWYESGSGDEKDCGCRLKPSSWY